MAFGKPSLEKQVINWLFVSRCLLEFRIQPGNGDVTLALKARQPEIFPLINQAMSRILSWILTHTHMLSFDVSLLPFCRAINFLVKIEHSFFIVFIINTKAHTRQTWLYRQRLLLISLNRMRWNNKYLFYKQAWEYVSKFRDEIPGKINIYFCVNTCFQPFYFMALFHVGIWSKVAV